MNNRMGDREEMLEALWHLRERRLSGPGDLRALLKERYREEDVAQLSADGLVTSDARGVGLTDQGSERARRLIRAHRIGERLIHDVLGREFESSACEFEHILATDIVDGICTLLGHPRECPHGFPIPEGECCRVSASLVRKAVAPLTELRIGQSARVAYVYTRSDQQLHRLTSLQIRPGTVVKLHQAQPTFVIECDGASIAMDAEVARNINVWVEGEPSFIPPHAEPAPDTPRNVARPRRRWRMGRRRGDWGPPGRAR
jgi:DtxR family transcriptional regulator, Mn-dependent transcriptional regulator